MICQNLVSTNRHIINTTPRLVSSIMQYFGSVRMGGTASRLRGAGPQPTPAATAAASAGQDTLDTMQNFAPLGTLLL